MEYKDKVAIVTGGAHGAFLQRKGCPLLVHRARRRQHNNIILTH